MRNRNWPALALVTFGACAAFCLTGKAHAFTLHRIAASLDVPVIFRGAGVVFLLAGGGLAFLTGRSRGDDARFRRAAIALALTLVVLVALAALFGLANGITLLAVLPLIAGTVLITRPAAAQRQESE